MQHDGAKHDPAAMADAGLRLILRRAYSEAASYLAACQRSGVRTPKIFRFYCDAMLFSDQLASLANYIIQHATSLSQDRNLVPMCLAVLQLAGRTEPIKAFEEAVSSEVDISAKVLKFKTEFAATAGLSEVHMECLRALAECGESERNAALYKYAAVCFQYGAVERGSRVIEELDPGCRPQLLLKVILDAANGDKASVLKQVETWLEDPEAPTWCYHVIEMLWMSTDFLELFELLSRAIMKWQSDTLVAARGILFQQVRAGVSPRDNLPEVTKIDYTSETYLEVIRGVIDQGAFRTASRLLADAEPLKTAKTAALHDSMVDLATQLQALKPKRDIVCDRFDQDWILSAPGDPGKMCVVFTGLNGLPDLGVETLDHYFADLGYQALYLRDFNRLAFARGIMSCGPGKSNALRALEAKLEALEVVDPIFIGVSLGATGAVEYGLELGIGQIITFGYHRRAKTMNRWRIGNSRMPLLNLRETCQNDLPLAHLEDQIGKAQHDFRIDMFYEQLNVVDAYYAASFVDLPGIGLRAIVASNSHRCIAAALIRGELQAIMRPS